MLFRLPPERDRDADVEYVLVDVARETQVGRQKLVKVRIAHDKD
jgi:hypothetical protein